MKEEDLELIPVSSKPGIFYDLPKIRELESVVISTQPDTRKHITDEEAFDIVRANNILTPGQPIISSIGAITEHISPYVDQHLQPILYSSISYLVKLRTLRIFLTHKVISLVV